MNEPNMNSEKADSGRNGDEKFRATILAKSPRDDPDVYLVEYPDGEQLYEPATPVNTVLFEDGLYEKITGTSTFYGTDNKVATNVDIEDRTFILTVNDHQVEVPEDKQGEMVEAFRRSNTGEILIDMYDDIMSGRVRHDIVKQFIDQFPEERVEETPNGWLVDDTFLVDYEGNNYLADQESVYVRSGNEMVEADQSKEAVELSFEVGESANIITPDGDSIRVGADEQEFLATVECLLYPGDYLDAELVDDVEQYKAEAQFDTISDIAQQATIGGYTDTKTGNYHRHSFNKHRASEEVANGVVDQELGLTAEAVDKLYFNDYDHAAPHEILARREEFENAPFDIFTDDVPNDDSRRWIAIEKAKDKAPIHPSDHEKIQDMFSDYDEEVTSMGKW